MRPVNSLSWHTGWDRPLLATTHKRGSSSMQEPDVFGDFLSFIKIQRFNIAINFHMSFVWSHVLTKRNNIHVDRPQLLYGTVSLERTEERIPCPAYLSIHPILVILFHQRRAWYSIGQSSTLPLCMLQHLQTLSKIPLQSRTNGVSSSTVSILCAYTSRPGLATTETSSRLPEKSPVKASTWILGALYNNLSTGRKTEQGKCHTCAWSFLWYPENDVLRRGLLCTEDEIGGRSKSKTKPPHHDPLQSTRCNPDPINYSLRGRGFGGF